MGGAFKTETVLDDLPNSVLSFIFGLIPDQKERVVCKFVCTRWRGVCKDVRNNPFVLSTSQDGSTKLWDMRSRRELCTLTRDLRNEPLCCAFSQDALRIAMGSKDGAVTFWNASNFQQDLILSPHLPSQKGCLCRGQWECPRCGTWHENRDQHFYFARYELGCNRSCTACALARPAQRPRGDCQLAGHSDAVTCCVFSPCGMFFVSGSKDRTLRVWSLEKTPALRQLQTLVGHSQPVLACSFGKGGLLVSTSADCDVRIWDPFQKGACARILAGHIPGSPGCLCSSEPYSFSECNRICNAQGHSGWVLSCAVSPRDGAIATSANDSTIRIWVASEGTCTQLLRGHSLTDQGCTCCVKPRAAMSRGSRLGHQGLGYIILEADMCAAWT
ncbi:hypothetical protein CYMTET_41554 [Cymbomonas tetramitiformis]|uniref:F-box domain-containing protein n=1 Tax=Cymbomonas tetramitiformis TaxID=36881 RepID=A0AAE0F252_9CHLO|nr:hypothetical protein CYMTET_41554 [Cymbomonas tetramitiformis]